MRTLVHVLNPFDSSSWLLGCKIGMASALLVLALRKCGRTTRLHVRCDSQKATMIAQASCFVFLPAGDPCPVSFRTESGAGFSTRLAHLVLLLDCFVYLWSIAHIPTNRCRVALHREPCIARSLLSFYS
jgi:hypothetical protein